MRVYPRIDLAGGESIHSLPNQEDPDHPFEDAIDVGVEFQRLGARKLHVVDVDLATEAGTNDDVLVRVLEGVGLPMDVGGGVRSMRRIQELLDTGASRVVLGTMGILHPPWLKEVSVCFGKKVVQSVDVLEGRMLLKGRTESSERPLEAFLAQADDYGIGGFIVNGCDQRFTNGTAQLLASLAERIQTPLWVAGAQSTMADLEHWQGAGLEGAVLGPEAYDGRLDLPQVMKTFAGPPVAV